MRSLNRRAFIAALFAPLVARFLPKPTGGLFNPKVNIAAMYKQMRFHPYSFALTMSRHYDDAIGLGYRPGLKVGDTITVRRPARFISFDPDPLRCEYDQFIATGEARSAA